ncbi:MAG: DUF1015 domain-containing protein [Bernardetiaceae bacterium]|jgi:uncharacterized protein (DUF1015 family)|nr:DUF1015 domain-containing protein [Bernardetiaceae bacterium]
MAEIRPFRAWRYRAELQPELPKLVSPLFDVVSDRQRQKLYQHPYNSLHLSVPPGPAPAEAAARTLAQWQAQGVLQRDPLPGIYPYYQHFSLPGHPRPLVRKGFIAFLRLTEWAEGALLRHENTMPQAVDDRLALLTATQLNVSPTHGLYFDPEFTLEPLLDAAMHQPLAEVEDYQGARDVLARITAPAQVAQIVAHLAPQPVILADGHHRYESSLAYWQQQRAAHPAALVAPYHYHLMYFTNGASDDLVILPTHRLLHHLPNFTPADFLQRLAPYFQLDEQEDPCALPEVIAGRKHTFGLLLANGAYKLSLKPGLAAQIQWDFPPLVRQLDLTVLHYFVGWRALSIPGRHQRADPHFSYERNFAECLDRVRQGAAQAALIVNPVLPEQVRQVCASGAVMPPKSTYFFPKVLTGLLFGSVAGEEL